MLTFIKVFYTINQTKTDMHVMFVEFLY